MARTGGVSRTCSRQTQVLRHTGSSPGMWYVRRPSRRGRGTLGIASIRLRSDFVTRAVGGSGMFSGPGRRGSLPTRSVQEHRRRTDLNMTPARKTLDPSAVSVAKPRVMRLSSRSQARNGWRFGSSQSRPSSQGSKALVTLPRPVAASSGKWRRITVLKLASSTHCMPSARVHLGAVVVGVEAVGLEPAAGVEDEDLEHRLAEAEVGRALGLGEGADQQVEVLDVVAVDLPEGGDGRPCRR